MSFMETRKIVVPGVLDFPNYEIMEDGTIFSEAQNTRKILKVKVTKQGYLDISLSRLGVKHYFHVHRLVALVFLGLPVGIPLSEAEVRHKDGKGNNGRESNNHYSNLEWGTALDNARDRVRHGTDPLGERHPRATLTNESVVLVKQAFVDGKGILGVVEEFNIPRHVASSILNNKNWKEVPWPCDETKLQEIRRPQWGNGGKNPSAKLDDEKVKAIKQMILEGHTNTYIARAFDVSPGTIWFIKTGRKWTHVKIGGKGGDGNAGNV
jgi:hypothetical protein